MADLRLLGKVDAGVTLVSNIFIDRFMAAANGEFVKIYLYLLRSLGDGEAGVSISSLADRFNHTEKDILRALSYWEKEGVVLLHRDGRSDLAGIELVPLTGGQKGSPSHWEAAAATEPELLVENRKKAAKVPREVHSTAQLEKLRDDDDFAQLMYIAQKYIGVILKPADCDIFAYLYNELKLSVELLEYLIEYCVSNGQKSIRYMESVALDWHGRGIMTVDRAKDYTSSYNRECFMVMKAFGIADRRPATIEKQMIDKWFHVYILPPDVILEACNRTISKIHQPSFEYADKILAGWKEQGVQRLADIDKLDKQFKEKESKPVQRPARQNGQKQGNKFHNFQQRGYDYDEILKKMK